MEGVDVCLSGVTVVLSIFYNGRHEHFGLLLIFRVFDVQVSVLKMLNWHFYIANLGVGSEIN